MTAYQLAPLLCSPEAGERGVGEGRGGGGGGVLISCMATVV